MTNIKLERLNHLIQQEISIILMEEVRDEELKFVTITGCDTSSDYSYCKVYFTVLEQEKKDIVLDALEKAASFIRGKLAERIDIRHTPELKFIYDTSIEYGEHIEKLIDQINDNKKGN